MTQEGAVVKPLVDKLGILPTDRVLECCAGNGGISQHLPGIVILNDISPEPDFEVHSRLDAKGSLLWELSKPDWTVTNPPFNEATPILKNALTHSRKGVAFLLRLSYYEPTQDRRDLLEGYADCMRYLIPINPRLRFRQDKDGSDKVTTAWFVWLKDFSWAALDLEPPFAFINWRAVKRKCKTES